jgi:hypothetical protein
LLIHLKVVDALESDEPAFQLFTDVFSRFIIRGSAPVPETIKSTLNDETQMARRVTFAVDEKVKKYRELCA